MKNQDKNREIQLERLFLESRASLPELEPDPALPTRIRALAAAASVPAAPRRRWAWVSLAGATVALSIFAGSYVGYRAWASTQEAASEQIGDADLFGSVSQNGFADDLAGGGEEQE